MNGHHNPGAGTVGPDAPHRCRFRAAVFGFLGVCALFPAFAADLDRKMDFNIPAQDLGAALIKFSQQTHLQVIVSENIRGKTTRGVTGKYPIGLALSQLLASEGLRYRIASDSSITIGKPAATTLLPGSSDRRAAGDEDIHLALTEDGNRQMQRVTPPSSGEAAVDNMESPGQATDEAPGMVVTGSRLRTRGAGNASPMIVVTAEDMKRQGFHTVEDVLRALPQNVSNVNTVTSLESEFVGGIESQGQSAINLRGLGTENTLVLVNGRRRATSSTLNEGTTNINTIPAGAIERIEVITDGASAIYGSDAMAGVVNIILKKDYQGAETRLRQETPSNEGERFTVDQLLGMNWSSGNVTASARLSRTDPVNAQKAGYITSNHESRGGDNFTSFRYMNVPAFDRALYPQAEDATPRQRELSVAIDGEQRFGDRTSVYAELQYSEGKTRAKYGIPSADYVIIPETNRFNDTGESVDFVSYVFLNEFLRGQIPANSTRSDQEALAGTLGMRFALPLRDWMLDVSGGRSKEKTFFANNDIDDALLDERLSGFDADSNPIPDAQQLNFFGDGMDQDPAAMNGLFVFGLDPLESISTLTSGQVSAEGALWRMPGGEARMALGVDGRKELLDFSGNPYRGEGFLLTPEPGRTVQAAFVEATIPLIGQANRLAGLHSLDLSVAARHEQYRINGPFEGASSPDREVTFKRTSPKYGISWYVAPSLKLRATSGESFRAPDLSDLFTAPYDFGWGYDDIIDPLNPGAGLVTPNEIYAGNPNLQPELSHNFTGGFDWKPKNFLRGLSLSASYSKIGFTNYVSSTSTVIFQQEWDLLLLPGVLERNPDGTIRNLYLIPLNLGTRRSESVDYSVTYDFSTTRGDLTLGLNGAYAIKLEDKFSPASEADERVGFYDGIEKHKWRSWVSWSRQNHGMSFYINHSGRYTNRYARYIGGGDYEQQGVDGYTTCDLTGFWRIDRFGVSINAGARNLTDAKFPFVNRARPWDPQRVDTRGRILFLEIARQYGLPGSN